MSAQANWDKIPLLLSPDGHSGKIVFPLHDESCYSIARLLLKMGLELMAPYMLATSEPADEHAFRPAKQHVLGSSESAWPYFVLQSEALDQRLVSLLASVPEAHAYAVSCGFDVFLHEVDSEIIFFFRYGKFRAGVCLSSRQTSWRQVLSTWGIPHVGCPVEFSEQYG